MFGRFASRLFGAAVTVSGTAVVAQSDEAKPASQLPPEIAEENEGTLKMSKANLREDRFRSFASVYRRDNQNKIENYMTPGDFIESLTVGSNEKEKMIFDDYQAKFDTTKFHKMLLDLDKTYQQQGKIEAPFKSFNNLGLLTYCDYVLLLTILSKSDRHFHIAFKLLDEDGSGEIDNHEYMLLEKFFLSDSLAKELPSEAVMEKQLLKTLFFGTDYKSTVNYDKFHEFAASVQREILDEEFRLLKESEQQEETAMSVAQLRDIANKQSDEIKELKRKLAEAEDTIEKLATNKSVFQTRVSKQEVSADSEQPAKQAQDDKPDTISAKSFAIAVLRNTQLPPKDILERIEKIEGEFPDSTVDKAEFVRFASFLNNLDDFGTVLKLLEQREGQIGPKQLEEAIQISTAQRLTDLVISIMYHIFDVDGDGSLSHKEIMSIMKSRLDRGLRTHLDSEKMDFVSCVKNVGYKMRLLTEI